MERDTFPPLAKLISDVRASVDLPRAMGAIASCFHKADFDPVQVALVIVEPTGLFRIKGLWSAASSDLEVGMAISANFTEVSRAIADELLMGTPVTFNLQDTDLGMLSDVLRNAGAESFLIVPMGSSSVVSLLTVASARANAFSALDTVLFEGLARAVEFDLLRKMATTNPE